jgi:hypothetical protein
MQKIKLMERLKGFVVGMLVMAILSTSVIVVAQTVTRQISYGINVVYNGQNVQFTEDMRPFVMDGRTFLSLRAMGEMLGYPVDFDPATNTAFVGSRTASPVRAPLTVAAPLFDSGGRFNYRVNTVESTTMGGTAYSNAVTYFSGGQGGVTVFSLHNLNGQYRMLTGNVGRVDGSHISNATMNIIGDGRVLATHELRGQDLPTELTVFVEDVHHLRIEFIFAGYNTTYAIAAFLE